MLRGAGRSTLTTCGKPCTEGARKCWPWSMRRPPPASSSGWQTPVEDLAAIAKEAGALLLVDTVTSLGGMEVDVERMGIDAGYSGTQKCLSCPPRLAPLSF